MKHLLFFSFVLICTLLPAQRQVVTSTADAGLGSLRDAVATANTGDSILFTSAILNDTIFLDSAILLDKALTIYAPTSSCANRQVISGQGQSTIFRIDSNITVSMSRLEMSFGNSFQGGAIYNKGNLTLTCCYFYQNVAVAGGAIYNASTLGSPTLLTLEQCDFFFNGGIGLGLHGGAILNAGNNGNARVDATASIFRNNSVQNFFGSVSGGVLTNQGPNSIATFTACEFERNNILGISPFVPTNTAKGGVIANTGGQVSLVDCPTISQNQARGQIAHGGVVWNNTASIFSALRSVFLDNEADHFGGAIANEGSCMILQSEISDNTVIGNTGRGGGIYEAGSGSLVVDQSTFHDNGAQDAGGAIFFTYTPSQTAPPSITNTTFSNNAAVSRGGGIALEGANQLLLTHCTLTLNSATDSGGAIFCGPLPTLSLRNTLIANNLSNKSSDLHGTQTSGVISLGGNLIGDNSNNNIFFLGSDLFGTRIAPLDAQLAPLDDYGGPTLTHFVDVGSPAINAGVNTSIKVDQRGTSRTITPDIGAFELHTVQLKAADSLRLCVGSPFVKMDSIVISDSTGASMHPGVSQTILLDIPDGFRLKPGQGKLRLSGNGLSNPTLVVSDSLVIVFYDRSNEVGPQRIVISDLLVQATQPGQGHILRKFSNAVLIGNSPADSMSHAFFTASALAPIRLPNTVHIICADTGEVPVAIPLPSPLQNGNTHVWYASPDSIGISSLDTTTLFTNYQFTDTCFFAPHSTCNLHFYLTQINNDGCESRPAQIEVAVNPVPNSPAPLFSANVTYCEGNDPPELQVIPSPSATFFWYDPLGNLLDSTATNSYTLGIDTINFSQDTSILVGVRQKVNGCLSRVPQVFDINGRSELDIKFEVDHLCLGDKTEFRAIAPPAAESYTWDFSDGLNNAIITTSGPDTAFVIQNTGFFEIILIVEDSSACKSSYEDVILVKDFRAGFRWSNICEGDSTLFTAQTSAFPDTLFRTIGAGSPIIDTISYRWDFGDPTGPFSGTKREEAHHYPEANRYLANLKVSSTYFNLHGQLTESCIDSTIEQITILPVINPVAVDSIYYDSFEDTARVLKQWLTGGRLNNWEVATPADSLLNGAASGTYAWVTDATQDYQNKTNAWVASPCYDLRQMKRPMLSMDLNVATEESFDGASVQYSADGGSTWELLGAVGSGINWYTDLSLQSNPGLQNNNRHSGWSGHLPWQTVRQRLDLDSLLSGTDSLLRFRINMGADSSVTGEGIAFDNFSLLERSSNVLIEQFVNTTITPAVYTLLDSNWKDIHYLQYHLSYPDDTDPIFVENQRGPDADARAFYYGISGPSNIALDGDARLTPDYETLQRELDLKILEDPQFDISIRDNGVAFSALQDVQRRIVLHVAVAEDRLPQASGVPYRYVVRKLFPDVGGTVVAEGLIKGEAKFVEVVWRNEDLPSPSIIPADRRDSIYLIAFVQDDISKRVYDVALKKASPQLFESRLGQSPDTLLRYALFPNPTSDWLEVQLAKPLPQSGTYTLYDLQGRRVMVRQVREGATGFRLDLSALAQGVYVLEMQLGAETRRERVVKTF